MSGDHYQSTCRLCGSLLHHEDACPRNQYIADPEPDSLFNPVPRIGKDDGLCDDPPPRFIGTCSTCGGSGRVHDPQDHLPVPMRLIPGPLVPCPQCRGFGNLKAWLESAPGSVHVPTPEEPRKEPMTTLLREYPIPSEQKSIAPGTEATLYSRPLPPGFVYDPERKPNIIGPEVAILAYGQDDQRLFITVANRTDQEVSVSAIFVGTIPADMMPSRDPYPYTSMSFVWELRGDNGMGTMIANMDIHRRGLDALDGWSDARIRAKVGKSRQEPGEAGRSLALDILRMMKTWLDTSMAELEKQAQDAPPQTTQTPRTQEGTQR